MQLFSRTNLYRGVFELPADYNGTTISFLLRDLGEKQWVYLNGQSIAVDVRLDNAGKEFDLDPALLRQGKNVVAIIATPLSRGARDRRSDERETGNPVVVRIVTSPGSWKRSLFNGLAQVIVQSTRQPGQITLTASSPSLSPYTLKLHTQPAVLHIVAKAK
ncbi:MAG: hypothetical protein ACREE6_15000 [Limisphaerales bacterium]